MSEISPSDTLLQKLTSEDLQTYLSLLGWRNAESPKSNWIVFEGPNDVSGEPLEIVLIRNGGSLKAYEYYASAINLLASLNDEEPATIITRVRNYERDVLNARNTSTSSEDSISLDLASKQVQGLRNLIRDATDQETLAVPYNPKQPTTVAIDMAQQYRLGHTFRGSFGFSVESPLNLYVYGYKQDAWIGDLAPRGPLARRVLERIVRGLLSANQAVEQQTDLPLVHGYKDAFNANMCKSILEIGGGNNREIEYTVLWSPTVKPSLDVGQIRAVSLNENAYGYIEVAQDKLERMVIPDTVTVRGPVEDIRTTDNPFGATAKREVIIRWANRPDGGRAVGITVEIDPEGYATAHQAQHDWQSVLVEGEARFTGSKWILDNPRNFRLADD